MLFKRHYVTLANSCFGHKYHRPCSSSHCSDNCHFHQFGSVWPSLSNRPKVSYLVFTPRRTIRKHLAHRLYTCTGRLTWAVYYPSGKHKKNRVRQIFAICKLACPVKSWVVYCRYHIVTPNMRPCYKYYDTSTNRGLSMSFYGQTCFCALSRGIKTTNVIVFLRHSGLMRPAFRQTTCLIDNCSCVLSRIAENIRYEHRPKQSNNHAARRSLTSWSMFWLPARRHFLGSENWD